MNWFIERDASLFMCNPQVDHMQGWPCRMCLTGKWLKNACVLHRQTLITKQRMKGEKRKKKGGRKKELGRDRGRKGKKERKEGKKEMERWLPVTLLTCADHHCSQPEFCRRS